MAALYAAEFFTEWNPLKPAGRWTAFGFDVALGLVLGYVFAFTWEAFTRALLLGNLALLAGVLPGCVLLSGRMLETRNWLNQLPIVLGTSIDGLLHSRTRRTRSSRRPGDMCRSSRSSPGRSGTW